MKATGRYSLIGLFLLMLGLFFGYRHHFKLTSELPVTTSYMTELELLSIQTSYHIEEWPIKISECTMSQCFDLSRCLAHDAFRVYVYPSDNSSAMSIVYNNILKVIRESMYYTDDPQKACLFVLGIDTVDRDRRSENYVKYVNELIGNLPTEIWNRGRNHVIFNLYHGTYPDYSDHDLGFDTGYALIARASANTRVFRENFDLSFPLFHKEHPLRTTIKAEWSLKIKDKYLVSFKGKRYVYGIGSETRDSLYHLHNGQSVIMVTTCKHNTDWKKYEDGRCEEDNVEYDHWDYEMTMANSTFCLTPRGRRLGSFRFLEALRLGCIPVVLSDDWELPFSEVIDWRQAVVIGHEDTVLTISDVLSAIPFDRILFMKQQSRGLYQRYFSSVEKIALTSLQIIEERIKKQRGEEPKNWNRLFLSVENFPPSNENGYTVLLRAAIKVSGRLNRIINLLTDINEIQKIIILWPKSRQMKTNLDRFGTKIFVQQGDFDVHGDILSQAQALQAEFLGKFVLFMDERVPIAADDIRFLVDVANADPYRLYGFYAADSKMEGGVPTIELKPSSRYSLILFHFALIKREYLLLFEQWMPTPAKEIASKLSHCLTLLMNMMVAELTGQSPVLIGSRIHDKWMLTRNYSGCLNKLVANVWPSGASLISSQAKINPLLHKNDIAAFRKKYAGV
ncbi:exostosin-1 [Loa loa]|uniref:Exostosin-1 n=1 Tax=Loa loa TaxID=7209 RepID=A0A1I7VWA3_LOALO|nr:exostosin-1 [Loa loa]EFO19790.2 exostosin-1 [Loa loa]